MDYNKINIHPRDRRIAFDALTHTYSVTPADGGAPVECDSVTTVVEDLFEKFDADYWAARKATATCPAEMLKAQWEEKGRQARELGTLLHDRIERHYLGEEPSAEALADRAFGFFMNFAAAVPLRPYRSEWRIYSERFRIAGTLDFLACDAQGRFVIYDWKRSAKIVDSCGRPIMENRWGKHAAAPVVHVPDTTFWHYAIQVSLYRYILETEYGISVVGGHLGTFHPDYDRYHLVDMPYLRKEAEAILNSRLR